MLLKTIKKQKNPQALWSLKMKTKALPFSQVAILG
jgi:hypothetical protein